MKEEYKLNEGGSTYKYYGDLLLTYCQDLKKLDDSIDVLDEENNSIITIPLNKQFDIFYNANNYYKKYQKSKTALIKIKEQIDICDDLIEYFNSIKYSLDNSSYLVIEEVKEELEKQGYLKEQKKTVKNNNKKVKEKAYKPVGFKYKETIIYAGQNNLENEYLTFKMASKTHMYLHVAMGHGAHVVIFNDHPNMELIKFAALIASYYSSYRMSSTVPVYYTLVKNVKKIPGGKPGKVIINNQKTIYVDPTNEILKYLL